MARVCSSVLFIPPGNLFFAGSYQISYGHVTQPTLPIAVDYVKCNGSEDTLRECIHFSHSYGCSHDEDVGVHCQPGIIAIQLKSPNIITLKYAANCDDGDVQLIGGSYNTDGDVLVCYNKRWGHICDNQREANAKTVCTQLGFSGGKCQCHKILTVILFGELFFIPGNFQRYYNDRTITPIQYNISLYCYGEEFRIFDCHFDSNTPQSCSYYLQVECTPGNIVMALITGKIHQFSLQHYVLMGK